MTPSLPTLSNASAIISPTLGSWAEIVATLAISARCSTWRALLSRLSETAAAAAFERAPRFLIEIQALGHTAPRLIVCESSCLVRFHAAAPGWPGTTGDGLLRPPTDPGRRVARSRAGHEHGPRCWTCSLLLDDGEHVTGGEHQVLLAPELHFGAAVLAVQHDIANFDVHGDALGASVVEPARADGDDLALLGLLFGSVRDDKAGGRGLLGIERAHNDPVFERLDNNLGGGRHDLTSPSGKG